MVSTLALVLLPWPGLAQNVKNHNDYNQLINILKIAYYYLAMLEANDQQRQNDHLRC